jgi:uncharacterized membrane protein YeaQ/YmgE (transglycosylase-associated protein family)
MVVKGGGYGLIGDIIVGIIGGLIAGWLLPQLGIVIGGGYRCDHRCLQRRRHLATHSAVG